MKLTGMPLREDTSCSMTLPRSKRKVPILIGNFEYAALFGPRLVAACGWIIHDQAAKVDAWIQLNDITISLNDSTFFYDRKDLNEVTVSDSGTYLRRGFCVIHRNDRVINKAAKIFFTCSISSKSISSEIFCFETKKLESYFSGCWQPIRRRLLDCLSNNLESEFDPQALLTLTKVTASWLEEIDDFAGAFSSKILGGVDLALFCNSGSMFFSGWKVAKGNDNGILNVSVYGFQGCTIHSEISAMRRPDLELASVPNRREKYPGFLILANSKSESSFTNDRFILFEYYEGARSHYTKVRINRTSTLNITNFSWNVLLDVEAISSEALQRSMAFMRQLSNQTKSESHFDSGAAVNITVSSVLYLDMDRNCRQARMTQACAISSINHNIEILAISNAYDSDNAAETLWTSGSGLVLSKIYDSIHDVANTIDTDSSFILIVSPGTISDEPLLDKVKNSLKGLSIQHDEEVIILLPSDFLGRTFPVNKNNRIIEERSVKILAAPLIMIESTSTQQKNLVINKGANLPPILMKKSTFKDGMIARWPHPISSMNLGALLVEKSLAGKMKYISVEGLDFYHNIPNRCGLDPAKLILSTSYGV